MMITHSGKMPPLAANGPGNARGQGRDADSVAIVLHRIRGQRCHYRDFLLTQGGIKRYRFTGIYVNDERVRALSSAAVVLYHIGGVFYHYLLLGPCDVHLFICLFFTFVIFHLSSLVLMCHKELLLVLLNLQR